MACGNVNQDDLSVGKLAILTESHMYITCDYIYILHPRIYPMKTIKDALKDLDTKYLCNICKSKIKISNQLQCPARGD